jgi:hypothetical protein
MTDDIIAAELLQEERVSDFTPTHFDQSIGLRPVSTRRASTRQLEEALGSFEVSSRSMRGTKSLSRQLNILLPTGLPPSIYEPLEYVLSRIIREDLIRKSWPFNPRPMKGMPGWANDLLRLHILSEVTDSRPWWIPAIHQAMKEWEDRNPNTLGGLLVKTVSRGMNILIAQKVVNLLGRLNRSAKPRLGDLNRYSSGRDGDQNFHSAMSYAIREWFLPSFKRLGLSRYITQKSTGRNIYEEMIQTSPMRRISFGITDGTKPVDGAEVLEEIRLSLRPSLLDPASGSWITRLDLTEAPPTPASDASWLVAEEHKARKELKLTERESLVLASGWAFGGVSDVREHMLERLGHSTHTSRTAARSLLRRSVFSLHYLPKLELCSLPDRVLLRIRGKSKELGLLRMQIEAGIPFCKSAWIKGQKGLIMELLMAPYTGPLQRLHLEREINQQGLEVDSFSIAQANSYRFNALSKALG